MNLINFVVEALYDKFMSLYNLHAWPLLSAR